MLARMLASVLVAASATAAYADLTGPAAAGPTVLVLPAQSAEKDDAPAAWDNAWPTGAAITPDAQISAVRTPAGKAPASAGRKLDAPRRSPSRDLTTRLLGLPKRGEPTASPAPTPGPAPDRSETGPTLPVGLGEPGGPETNPVPAPGAFLLGALGLAGVGWLRRRGL